MAVWGACRYQAGASCAKPWGAWLSSGKVTTSQASGRDSSSRSSLLLSACGTLPPAQGPSSTATLAPVTRLSGRLAVQVAQDAQRQGVNAGQVPIDQGPAGVAIARAPKDLLNDESFPRRADLRMTMQRSHRREPKQGMHDAAVANVDLRRLDLTLAEVRKPRRQLAHHHRPSEDVEMPLDRRVRFA